MGEYLKPSRYNVLVDAPGGNGVYVYNTLTGALTSWTADEALTVRRALAGDPTSADDALLAALRDARHLVEDDLDELELVRRRKRLGATDAARLDVVVMPTLDCNFACTYCYETRRSSRMEEGTAEALLRWLDARIPAHPLTLLHWFGGEPLLELETVLRITRAATVAANTSGRVLATHVTTNGWLLDADTAGALVAEGIADYQVTIDGPAETHDRMRVLRGGGATFARVFGNVESLLRAHPHVHVTLRSNFDEANLPRVRELLGAFPEDIRPRLRFALEPIFGPCGFGERAPVALDVVADTMSRIQQEAARLGFAGPSPASALEPGKLVYCYAEREHQAVIGPAGEVYKCSACDFSAALQVGRLSPDGSIDVDRAAWQRWVAPDELAQKCLDCEWLPTCMGGCSKVRLENARRSSARGCTLVATNASQVLKALALGGIDPLVRLAAAPDRVANPGGAP